MRLASFCLLALIALVLTQTDAVAHDSHVHLAIVHADGAPAANVAIKLCDPDGACPWQTRFRTDAEGRVTFDPTVVASHLRHPYYLDLSSDEGLSGYYHEQSPGRFSSTSGRWTLFDPADGAPELRAVTLPPRLHLEISGAHDGDWSVFVCSFSDGPYFGGQACRRPNQANLVDRPGLSLFVPAVDYHIELRSLTPPFRSLYLSDHGSATGSLTNNPAHRTRFSAGSVPSQPLTITLPRNSVDVTLTLKPGANFVSWSAGRLTLTELCDSSDGILGVLAYDNDLAVSASRICALERTWHDSNRGNVVEDFAVTFGTPLWLYWDGSAGVELVIEAPSPSWPQTLGPGLVYVAWPGPDDTSLDLVALSLGIDPEAITRLSPNPATEPTVDYGDILVFHTDVSLKWMPPTNAAPELILVGAQAERAEPELRALIQQAQEFVFQAAGVALSDVTVLHSKNFERHTTWVLRPSARASRGAIWIMTLHPPTIVHEYFHVLQSQAGRGHVTPDWITEGTATYVEQHYKLFSGAFDDDDYEQWHNSVVAKAESWTSTLRELESASWTPSTDLDIATRPYLLGALATEYLVQHHGGLRVVMDFFMLNELQAESGNDHDRRAMRARFETAFGISMTDFYDRFAEYRANGFQLDDE